MRVFNSISQKNFDAMITLIDVIIVGTSLIGGLASSLNSQGSQTTVDVFVATASISTCLMLFYSWKMPFDFDNEKKI